jgi:hypothetical protein
MADSSRSSALAVAVVERSDVSRALVERLKKSEAL